MSSDQPRRPREGGSGASPMGSTAAIIIAVVAVVAGFLILRQIRDDSGSSAGTGGDSVVTTTIDPTVTTLDPTQSTTAIVTAPPVSTTPPIVTEGATAVVANASRVNGAAGVLTTALTGKKFIMAKAINATVKQEVTTVLYDPNTPAALDVANSIATLMGGVAVQTLPSPPQVDGGALPAGATVLVMLGSDKASLTLEQMGTPGTTTVAGATTTIPAVDAGATTTTTG